MWLMCGLSIGWALAVFGTTAIYSSFIRNRAYIGIQPDDYHTYDKAALVEYWETGKRWRARMSGRAIVVAIPTFIIGEVIVFILSFLKVG